MRPQPAEPSRSHLLKPKAPTVGFSGVPGRSWWPRLPGKAALFFSLRILPLSPGFLGPSPAAGVSSGGWGGWPGRLWSAALSATAGRAAQDGSWFQPVLLLWCLVPDAGAQCKGSQPPTLLPGCGWSWPPDACSTVWVILASSWHVHDLHTLPRGGCGVFSVQVTLQASMTVSTLECSQAWHMSAQGPRAAPGS